MERQVVSVYVDAFTEQWLPQLYVCAERTPELLVTLTADIDSANLILGINDTLKEDSASYQISEIEFVVTTNAQNSVTDLSFAIVQDIYSGRIHNWAQLGGDDVPVHLWAYPSGSDLNTILLGDRNLSSLAKQAQNPGAMHAAIESDVYAIGFLPRGDILSEKDIQIIELDNDFSFPVLLTVSKSETKYTIVAECLQGADK